MENIDWKNVAERCMWTFLEGFLGCLTFSAPLDKAAILAACMAGISAVKTVLLDLAREQNK